MLEHRSLLLEIQTTVKAVRVGVSSSAENEVKFYFTKADVQCPTTVWISVFLKDVYISFSFYDLEYFISK